MRARRFELEWRPGSRVAPSARALRIPSGRHSALVVGRLCRPLERARSPRASSPSIALAAWHVLSDPIARPGSATSHSLEHSCRSQSNGTNRPRSYACTSRGISLLNSMIGLARRKAETQGYAGHLQRYCPSRFSATLRDCCDVLFGEERCPASRLLPRRKRGKKFQLMDLFGSPSAISAGF